MKALILGSNGMLGNDLIRAFKNSPYEFSGCSRADLDITDHHAINNCLMRHEPQLVILAAAFTHVDDCESKRDLAFAVNAAGAHNVALACRKMNARLFFISTDYVFNGEKKEPYNEEDKPDPINTYGESKLAGENHIRRVLPNHLIIRTSWLFGIHGRNFVEAILEKAVKAPVLKVVNDQTGSPTYTFDLALAIVSLVGKNVRGTINICSGGSCTWYEFARTILDKTCMKEINIEPISSDLLNAPAKRPLNSRLTHDRFFETMGYTLRPWSEALGAYLKERQG